MTRCLDFLMLPAFALTLPSWGHELEVKTQLAAPAVIVHATYAGTEPVPFAKIQIFSPADPSKEFQAANTDKRGYFSFVPEGSGSWKVVIDDELGHRKEIAIAVPDSFTNNTSESSNGGSRAERALLGIALIFGVTGVWYGYRSRRS
jgi:nickel transport protein